ncbi:MAG: hypothetical protein Q8O19_02705 [Rectinemataceae bacterium]|nr:hypothetical protein [Rectinemataceae bacterium]
MKKLFNFIILALLAFFFVNAMFYFFLVTDLSEGYVRYLEIIGIPSSLVFPGDSLYLYFEKNKEISRGLRMVAVMAEYFIIPCAVDIAILFSFRFGFAAIKTKMTKLNT